MCLCECKRSPAQNAREMRRRRGRFCHCCRQKGRRTMQRMKVEGPPPPTTLLHPTSVSPGRKHVAPLRHEFGLEKNTQLTHRLTSSVEHPEKVRLISLLRERRNQAPPVVPRKKSGGKTHERAACARIIQLIYKGRCSLAEERKSLRCTATPARSRRPTPFFFYMSQSKNWIGQTSWLGEHRRRCWFCRQSRTRFRGVHSPAGDLRRNKQPVQHGKSATMQLRVKERADLPTPGCPMQR